ncbi:hypothetical protein E3N88_04454 [Mikania micrantha]|uniref:Ribosome biogenesis protein NOP53 n=1 Tax=Mikania micrantha TaxID=192012 RepID=A0A5N6PWA3_9ASTR|nr:hypothetical protein E3N88_04454 [Mikania micrantha]
MVKIHQTLTFIIWVTIVFSLQVLAKKSPRPISDTEVREKKQNCYSEIELGYWGQQCKSSMVAKENCALKCLSPSCYELIYESDPVSNDLIWYIFIIIFVIYMLYGCFYQLEEGERDYLRSQEYKYCMHSNIWRHPWDLVPSNHTAMSLNETTTPIENQNHTTFSPRGTTMIQGKGNDLSGKESGKENRLEITPKFLAQNREQILLLLQKEEKERQLKEVRTQLKFEDCSTREDDEEYVETELKHVDEEEVLRMDMGEAKKKHGIKKKSTKKLEFEDDYSKPYRPSTARAKGERRWGKPHFQPRLTPREPFESRFGAPRKPVIDAEVKLPSLTKTPSEILAMENIKFTKHAPLRPGPRKNMDKYCDFHKENGHATDNRFSLRRQIESAIKTRKLSHLIKELQKTPQVGKKRKKDFHAASVTANRRFKKATQHM